MRKHRNDITKKNIRNIIYEHGIFFILFFIMVFFGLLTGGTTLRITNILNVILNMTPVALIAMGVTLVIITTGIDLSSGSVLAFSSVFTALFAQTASAKLKFISQLPQLPLIVPLLIGLSAGALAGFVNGLLITKTGIPPFIATLGMMTAGRGLALLPTKGATISNLNPALIFLGQGKILGIPVPIWILMMVILLSHLLLEKTRLGRHALAIGGNLQAAKTSGIKHERVLILIYTYAGLLSGLAGIIVTGIVASGQPTSGMLYELDAIASSVIGGASFYGGVGTISGTMVGMMIIGSIKNGLDLMFVSPYYQQIVRGLIIIIAVIGDVQKRKWKG